MVKSKSNFFRERVRKARILRKNSDRKLTFSKSGVGQELKKSISDTEPEMVIKVISQDQQNTFRRIITRKITKKRKTMRGFTKSPPTPNKIKPTPNKKNKSPPQTETNQIKSLHIYLKNSLFFFLVIVFMGKPLFSYMSIIYLQLIFAFFLILFYGVSLNQNLGLIMHEVFLCFFLIFYLIYHASERPSDLMNSVYFMVYFAGLSISFLSFVFDLVFGWKRKVS